MNIELTNIENLTDEERKQLDMLVEKANKPKRKRFVPKIREAYWFIAPNGTCNTNCFYDYNIDNDLIKIRNCFSTYEEAHYYADRIKLIAELWDFADENNEGEIDWGNAKQDKYLLLYDHYSKGIEVKSFHKWKYESTLPYFTSEEVAKKAIDHFGEELKTLFLNYGEK